MLPTALLTELYGEAISKEDYESLLDVAPNESEFSPISFEAFSSSSSSSSSTSCSDETSSLHSFSSLEQESVYNPEPQVIIPMVYVLPVLYSPLLLTEAIDSFETYWLPVTIGRTRQRTNNYQKAVNKKKNPPKDKFCSFCFNNREKESVYTSHDLRDSAKNITCLSLFKVVCRHCGATGQEAHTPKFCPINPDNLDSVN